MLPVLCILMALSGLAPTPNPQEIPPVKYRVRLGTRFEWQADPINARVAPIFKKAIEATGFFEVANENPDVIFAVYIDRNKTLTYLENTLDTFEKQARDAGQAINEPFMEGVRGFIQGAHEETERELRVVLIFTPRGQDSPIPHYINVGPFHPELLEQIVKELLEFCETNIFGDLRG